MISAYFVFLALWPLLSEDLKILTVFTRFLKQRRIGFGAIDIDQNATAGSELHFSVDSDGNPVEVSSKDSLEIHDTIAELMIIANESIAKLIYMINPKEALLRIHSLPSAKKLLDIYEVAEQMRLFTTDNADGDSNVSLDSNYNMP